jgi:signal transduction histidine kinase
MSVRSVRFRLALTVVLTGLFTALGVIVAVGLAFERFEREAAYARADAFLGRVVALHADLLEQHERAPEPFTLFLKSLLLLEPDSQLYLLGEDGTVLAHTGSVQLAAGFKVALGPVMQAVQAAAAGRTAREAAYVMGDDPQYMDVDAVVAARALRRASIAPDPRTAGYLYIVCRKPGLPPSRLARFAASWAGPALGPVLALVLLATLIAAWIIATVTRPLAVLSDEVARAARAGFGGMTGFPGSSGFPAFSGPTPDDEFGRLRGGFQALLARLRAQWDELRSLDQLRREGVSNLSHDLRSPLTAAVAGLETLQRRWAGDPAREDDRRLVDVALRNTHNAARLVRSLGDLALLDESGFALHRTRLDLAEVLDDIVVRFAERAQGQGVTLGLDAGGGADAPLVAEIDVELFERAIANLVDNALRFTPAGGRIRIEAAHRGPRIAVSVADSGSGIAADALPRLFDRYFRGAGGEGGEGGEGGRHGHDSGEPGKGLGLAIVKRIAELHGGSVAVQSAPGRGTRVTIELPATA